MSLVSLSASGYLFSSIAVLNNAVRIGARKGVRSLMMAGLILWMSLALWGLIFFIVLIISCSVMCLSVNCGACVLCCVSSFSMYSSGMFGMFCVVLCPMVM